MAKPGASKAHRSSPVSAHTTKAPAPERPLILDWLFSYRREYISGDLLAGTIVAIMLLPQSIAYAMLAGLPPEAGLYAGIVPLVLYPVFGTSTTLAVGPVAILTLLTGSALAPLAAPGSPEYVMLALALTLLGGCFLLLAGLLRLGRLTNFISQPVISGFTTAAALIIGFSQVKHLLGLNLPRTSYIPTLVADIFRHLQDINPVTLLIGVAAIALLAARGLFSTALTRLGVSETSAGLLARSVMLVIVITAIIVTWLTGLDHRYGVSIVGTVPAGLPRPVNPLADLATLQQLLAPAAIIAIVGYIQSLAMARSLAARRREMIDPDRELLGLGLANIGSAFTGGFPVTGGFSRSVVNLMAGARTQAAALVTATLIAIALVFLAPALYYLPKAILAAIIVVAVASLIDFTPFFSAWRYNRADGLAYGVTFAAVIALGVERGIMLGVATSIFMYLWRTSQPHYAILGRIRGTEHFRNVKRHYVDIDKQILIMRIDENLYFANTSWLENRLLNEVARHKSVRHVILNLHSVSYIDSSALRALESAIVNLRASGVTLHFAEIKGPVLDHLMQTDLLDKLAPGQIFLTTFEAVNALHDAHANGKQNGGSPDSDRETWTKIEASGNTREIEEFLKDHPGSIHAGQARRKLLTIADDKAFRKAEMEDTPEAWRAYLQRGRTAPRNRSAALARLRHLTNGEPAGLFARNMLLLYLIAILAAATLYRTSFNTPSQTGPTPSSLPRQTIESDLPLENDNTAYILALQQRLRELGYDPGKIDGHLGPKTRSALSSYIRHTDDNLKRLNRLLRQIDAGTGQEAR